MTEVNFFVGKLPYPLGRSKDECTNHQFFKHQRKIQDGYQAAGIDNHFFSRGKLSLPGILQVHRSAGHCRQPDMGMLIQVRKTQLGGKLCREGRDGGTQIQGIVFECVDCTSIQFQQFCGALNGNPQHLRQVHGGGKRPAHLQQCG